MAGIKNYKQELSERKKQLKDAIAKAEKELSKRKPIDTRWFEAYRKIDCLRVDLMTVKSRLEHLGKRNKRSGIQTAHIDINHLNNLDLL